MASAALRGMFELGAGVPARVEDETVAVYRIVERQKIATTKFHVTQMHLQRLSEKT